MLTSTLPTSTILIAYHHHRADTTRRDIGEVPYVKERGTRGTVGVGDHARPSKSLFLFILSFFSHCTCHFTENRTCRAQKPPTLGPVPIRMHLAWKLWCISVFSALLYTIQVGSRAPWHVFVFGAVQLKSNCYSSSFSVPLYTGFIL